MIPASATRHTIMALAHPERSRVGYSECLPQVRQRWLLVQYCCPHPARPAFAGQIRRAHRRSICAHWCSAAAKRDRLQPAMQEPMLQMKMEVKMTNPAARRARICSSLRRCTSNCAWWRDRCGNTNGRLPVERLSGRRDICPPFWCRPPWRYSPQRRRNWFQPEYWRRSPTRISLNDLTCASPVMLRDPSHPTFR